MESAIIFGKNRHLYGGLEPSHMPGFSVSSLTGKLELACTLPEDTYVDGQLLCTVAGVVIRSKTDGYPKDEFDGTLIADITTSGVIEDTINSMGSVVYYAAFPYTDQGVYNRSERNRTLHDPDNSSYLFGYDLDTTEPDPYERVAYPSDVNNANYSPVKMNYSTGVFDYGGWSGVTPGSAFMPRPCMLKNDGTVHYYLDPNDYTKKEDGSPSDVANIDYAGNAMVEWPKIYTKRWEENGIYHFRCSGVKQDDTWDCWCNYDKNDNEIDHFYTAIYLGYDSSSKLRSLSGYPCSKLTYFDTYKTYARANGDDWGVDTIADWMLIQDLLVMMAHSTDCQTAYGNGIYDDDVVISGTYDTKGMFYGSNVYTNIVKVFGMENVWGWTPRTVDGLIYNRSSSTLYAKITRGKHDGSSVSDYIATRSDPAYSGYIKVVENVIQGYVSKMKTTEFGRFPIDGNGSATEYECDSCGLVSGPNDNKNYYVSVGGAGNSSTPAMGPFCYDRSESSDSDRATALSCKPSVS